MITENGIIDIKDAKAETWLAAHYPEINNWVVNHAGCFYRNYTDDLKACDADQQAVTTSRSGIFDVLPERMFFSDAELRFLDNRNRSKKLEEMYEERNRIKTFFMPFDSMLFNTSLRIERTVNSLLENKTADFLLRFFDYNIMEEENPYVRQLAPLIIHASKISGNLSLVTRLLSALLDCKVEHHVLSGNDLRFVIHKKGLNSTRYREFTDQLKPLFEFVQHWFLPMDTFCLYKVKDKEQPFVLEEKQPLVLDYNTQI